MGFDVPINGNIVTNRKYKGKGIKMKRGSLFENYWFETFGQSCVRV